MSELELWKLAGYSDCHAAIICLVFSAIWTVVFALYKTDVKKQIENLKAKNEKLNYITKTQFDAEFKIYQELSKSMFNSILKSYLLFPTGIDKISTNNEERLEEYKKRYKEATEALFAFQDLVFKYAAFIKEDLYKQFDDIRLLIQLNVNYFPDIRLRDDVQLPVDAEMDCFNRTKEISDKQDTLIKNLRDYLQSLKITEDK